MRGRAFIAVAVATLALALVAPSLAAAQGTVTSNPLSPGLPVAPSATPTTSTTTPSNVITTPSTSTSGGSLSGGDAVAIAIGALVILGGISLFIWRDARRRAPVRHRAAMATAGEGGRAGTKPKPKTRKLSPAERRRRKRGRAR